MMRATTFAIAAAAVVAVSATASSNSATNNFNPALNSQPIAGCGFLESFDVVTPPVLPPDWTAINAIDPDGVFWQTSDSGDPSPPAQSLPNAAWVNDPDTISDKYLDSPTLTINPNAGVLTFSNNHALHDGFRSASLTFSHNYALHDGFDGGVLEVSVDGGPFQDILTGGSFIVGGYNGTISTCCGNPLAGRQAWTGNSGGFIVTAVDLIGFAGHSIVLRWRMASDSSGSGEGWRVDDVAIGCESSTPTPTPPPCSVSSEGCGSVVTIPPTDFNLNVSESVDPATLNASDLTVNGIPADNVNLLNGNMTIDFTFNTSPAVQGVNNMHIAAGAFNCAFGSPVAEFTCTFVYNPPTPTPTTTPPPTPPFGTPTPPPRPTPRPRPTPLPRPTPPH